MATQNPYSNSLLMDAFRGSLSNAESLGRGFGVAPIGLLGDVNALARQYVTPRLPQSVQGLLQSAPAAPTTEQILSNIPRVSNPRMETAGMEQLGAAMNPRGPVDLARGVGRVAGNAINEAMVYDRGLLAGITPQPMRMDVYHGSPYGPFNKFDPSKARTGEGNASYGEGAYLAQARGTGETYRKTLARENQAMDLGSKLNMVDVGGTPLTKFNVDQSPELLDAAKAGKTEFVDLAKSKLSRWEDMAKDSSYPFPDYAKEKITAYKGLLDATDKGDVSYTGSGFLYKVDLPDESIAKMLDYDKPLSKQAPEVQNALAELGISVDKTKMGEYEDALLDALTNPNSTGQLPKQPLDLTGEQILRELERNASTYFPKVMEGRDLTGAMINPRAGVSDLLGRKGVTGVRYLDQMSRDVGEGTSNFVVFPKYQDLLTIKEINDQPVQGLLGQAKPISALPSDYYELNTMATQAYTDLRAKPSQEAADYYKSIMKARDEAANNPSNNYTPPAPDVVPETYKGQHQAPTKDGGAPLWNLKDTYPDDFYSSQGARFYGDGADEARDRMIVSQMQSMKGRPDKPVTIYRAVPKSVPTKEALNTGDWITLDRQYAKEHGEGALNGDYKIVKKTVKARDLFTNGDSIYEMGYDPQPYIPKSNRGLLD